MARLLLLALVFEGCGSPATVAREQPQVIRTLPHDPDAYTQGLLFHEGRFFESTGRYGSSTLREVDAESGEVVRMVELDERYFGEGLARVGSRLIQLTWQEHVAFVYDIETFEVTDTLRYDGRGWGLCHDGDSLFMTSGGSTLYRRDPETFELLESRPITSGGRAIQEVNELECVGPYIYANVYMSDRILRIDKESGDVLAEIDASGLVPEGGRPSDSGAVLNGIAYNPENDTFFLTGKLWPTMFEVRFVPATPEG
jgi:glutaminyl-peptide cyclotransferase